MAASGKVDLRAVFRDAEQCPTSRGKGADSGQETCTVEQSRSHCGLVGRYQSLES